jgi:hypothetical protein
MTSYVKPNARRPALMGTVTGTNVRIAANPLTQLGDAVPRIEPT